MLVYIGRLGGDNSTCFILDTDDGVIDIVDVKEIRGILSLGIEILGCGLDTKYVSMKNDFIHLRDKLFEISTSSQLLYQSTKKRKLYVYSYGHCYIISADKYWVSKYNSKNLVLCVRVDNIGESVYSFSRRGVNSHIGTYEECEGTVESFRRMVIFD